MSRGTVLLVDDNALTRRFIQRALRDENLTIVEAVGVRSALAIAESSKADLVLLDLVLADGSGFDLVEPLRKALRSAVPVLAVTGLISRNDEGRLGSAGFDDIVNKPIDPVRLRAAVRAYLPERSVSRDRFGVGKRLVFADDDPVQRKLGVFRLARMGFEVHAAADGEQAFELATKVRPDVVVSDVLMPRVDGFELCVRIRRDPALSQVPVVLLTNSYLEEADRSLANKIGADGYLIRTPDLRDVAETLRNLVGVRERVSHVAVAEDATAAHERLSRAVQQLDRQLALNVTLTQRTAVLSAQLGILGGLTSALVEQGDIESALDQALHACLDAGGISWGLLVVRHREQWTRRSLGLTDAEKQLVDASLETLIERLLDATDGRAPTRLSGNLVGSDDGEALVVPISWREELLGAFVLRLSPTLDEQRQAFVQVVAGQLALVVALARTFQRLDDSSKAERARARLIASTLEAVGKPLLVIDGVGRATGWNQPGEAFRFLTRGLSAGVELLTSDQSRPLAVEEEPIARALAGETIDDAEVCVRPGSEEPRWLRLTARAFHGDDDRTAGAVVVVRDVTDERRAQARQIVNDRLASVGVLAAGIAHEINNPLTSVLAEIEMAVARIPGMDRAIEHLNTALDAAHRVRTIVSDLRTLSREGSGDALVAVDVARALDTALRMAVPHTRGRVEVKTEIGDLPWILGNEGRLVQVFLNLIVNAAQAMNGLPQERRSIRVRAMRGRDGGARVDVVDTGTGMTAEVRNRIFTPFFTTKPLGTGTGLGLSICQRIITQLGGTIDCDSAPNRGTTFTLWLPPAPDQIGSSPAPSGGREAVSARILVVDADPFARQLVTRALRAEHDVVALGSADVAWSRIEGGEPFDLVLYDGDALAPSAAELWSRLAGELAPLRDRVVFLTGPMTGPATREFLASTGARVLSKPIDATTLKRMAGNPRAPLSSGPSKEHQR